MELNWHEQQPQCNNADDTLTARERGSGDCFRIEAIETAVSGDFEKRSVSWSGCLRIGWMVVFALTTASSASYGDEPLPDYEASRIPVGDRLHPDYDPVGYRLGSLFFYPALSAGLRYDSNVFASGANPRSDWAALISPELTIRYGTLPSAYRQNPSRFSYEINLNADIYQFRDLTSENRVDARGRLRTHWDIAQDLQLDTAFEAARKHDERGDSSSPLNAATPVPYNDLRGEATLTKTIGRYGVAFNGSVRNLTYENVNSFEGRLLDQSGRDGTIYSTYIKPFYEFAPGYRAFVRAAANTRNYEASGADNRDSHGYDVRAGLDFAVTPLISGSVEVGYMSQTYDNPLIRPVDGLSFKGESGLARDRAPDGEARSRAEDCRNHHAAIRLAARHVLWRARRLRTPAQRHSVRRISVQARRFQRHAAHRRRDENLGRLGLSDEPQCELRGFATTSSAAIQRYRSTLSTNTW